MDPDAPAPARPRWFALDSPALQARLAWGPALVQWLEERHPARMLLVSGCTLESLSARTPRAAEHRRVLETLGLETGAIAQLVQGESVGVSAVLRSPRGMVLLPEAGCME